MIIFPPYPRAVHFESPFLFSEWFTMLLKMIALIRCFYVLFSCVSAWFKHVSGISLVDKEQFVFHSI